MRQIVKPHFPITHCSDYLEVPAKARALSRELLCSTLACTEAVMAPLAKAAAPALRRWSRPHVLLKTETPLALAKPASAALVQHRDQSNEAAFDSPFHRSGGTTRTTTNIPTFGKYRSNRSEIGNRVFQYFMVGTFGAVTAMGAKATVQGMHYQLEKGDILLQ